MSSDPRVIPYGSPAVLDACQAACDRVDEVAMQMEMKWGAGRLHALVPQEWAERFLSQRRKFHEANQTGELSEVRTHADAMIRAWRKLDEIATAAGAEELQPAYFETRTPDGAVLVIARSNPEGWLAARENRQAVVYTVEEIARLLVDRLDSVYAVKKAFPGATVVETRVKIPRGGDEVPF